MYELNEKVFVEKRLSDEKLYKDKGLKNLLIRYYLEQGLEHNEIIDKVLHYFLSRSNGATFKEITEKMSIKYALSYELKNPRKLTQIEYLPVSSSELAIIRTLESKQDQKYLFSLLCIAKYKNLTNPKNDNWTHKNIGEVFKSVANLCYTQEQQYELISDLMDRGLVKMGTTNLNIQVLFIDNADEIIKVDSFIDLGKFYGDIEKGKMIRCSECGKMVKKSGNGRTKYCNGCAKKINIEKTKINKN